MRLFNIHTLKLEDSSQLESDLEQRPSQTQVYPSEKVPRRGDPSRTSSVPFICISHVWYDRGRPVLNEVLPEDLADPGDQSWKFTKRKGADKILGACAAVRKWSEARRARGRNTYPPVNHIWIDTCCVNQSDPAEVSASINSMFRWYGEAVACFVYLHDLAPSISSSASLSKCQYWTRKFSSDQYLGHFTFGCSCIFLLQVLETHNNIGGWTLQEMIATFDVEFFDAGWNPIGNKAAGSSMEAELSRITGIDIAVLRNPKEVRECKLSLRMSWASGRTTRFEEDRAYSLLGIFNVQMPTLYGEGEGSAFRRLQEEIIKYSDDHSIFAWYDSDAAADDTTGLLAPSIRCFQTNYTYLRAPRSSNTPYAMTNKGLSIRLCLLQLDKLNFVASLDCEKDADHVIGLYLRCISKENQEYRRVRSNELTSVKKRARGELVSIFVRQVFI